MKKRFLPPGMKHGSEAYELLADSYMHALTGAEWKTAFYVARRTIGLGKESDPISLTQICKGIRKRDGQQLDRGTGLSRQAAVEALKGLAAKGLLATRVGKAAEVNHHRLNWEVILADSQKQTSQESRPPDSPENRPEVVKKVAPQLSDQLSDQLSGVQLSGRDLAACGGTPRNSAAATRGERIPGSAVFA